MEATDAPIEDVTLALEICGGNEKQALEMLNGGGEDNFNTQSARALLNEKPKTSLENPPPRMDSAPTFIDDAPQRAMRSHQAKVTDEKGIDDELVTKPPETPMYAPTLRTSPTATSKASENIKENKKSSIASQVASAPVSDNHSATERQDNEQEENAANREGTYLVESPSTSAINNNTFINTATTSSTSVRAQIQPRQTEPGAVRVPGLDGENADDDEDSATNTTVASTSLVDPNNPVLAKPVDEDEERRRIQEEIDREVAAQREQERVEQDGEIPEAEVVNQKNHCSTRVKILSGIAVVLLATVAIVLGTVLPRLLEPEEPTEPSPPSPQEMLRKLESVLSPLSFDNGTALQTPSTPQNNALVWLANNTNLDTYSDEKKIQRYVLAVLYYSTNGTDWLNKDGWLSNGDECDWYNLADGSFCINGSVAELDFYDVDTENGNNLVGTIPNELALLSDSLGKLILRDNLLTGIIPSEIASLKSLTGLSLNNNRLTGMIPKETASLTNLALLNLRNNFLTGSIQIALPTSLSGLYLDRNSMMGTIPSEIALLTNLNDLGLAKNRLRGTIPTEIGILTQLTGLGLCCNSLMGSIPTEIAFLTSLAVLALWDNSLTGTVPAEIGFLTSLTALSLQINNLTGEFTCPAFISQCYISCDPVFNYTEACRSL
jgi:hypothetical protein